MSCIDYKAGEGLSVGEECTMAQYFFRSICVMISEWGKERKGKLIGQGPQVDGHKRIKRGKENKQ